jgi:hypothetical protein
MSTRGALGFKINGTYHATYNHFDSYPEGLGREVVRFIRSVVKKNKLDVLREHVAHVQWTDEESLVPPELAQRYTAYTKNWDKIYEKDRKLCE